MNNIMLEDCKRLLDGGEINWDYFEKKNILITGATGLIGQNLVHAFAYVSNEKKLDINLLLPVRNREKAKFLFDWDSSFCNIVFCDYDITLPIEIEENVDLIIHAAAPTESAMFVNRPADVLFMNFISCKNLLDLALSKQVQKFVLLSTMEVYGATKEEDVVREESVAAFNPTVPRNSYPIGKISAEALCSAYHKQYGLPYNCLRLTQTFGPGASIEDARVFAYLAKCAIQGEDIVLKTKGRTKRMYLYTADAVSAIAKVAEKGEDGETYTVANEETYISIADMAQLVADEIAGGGIKVQYDIGDAASSGYAEEFAMRLDTSKLRGLGWKAKTGLAEAFDRMIDCMKEGRNE